MNFSVSTLHGPGMAFQEDYFSEHFRMTVCFLVIKTERTSRSKNILVPYMVISTCKNLA